MSALAHQNERFRHVCIRSRRDTLSFKGLPSAKSRTLKKIEVGSQQRDLTRTKVRHKPHSFQEGLKKLYVRRLMVSIMRMADTSPVL